MIVIEHNLDVIACADWVIDLGPEGGDKGGEVVAEGTPEHIAACERSYTGQYLQSTLRSAALGGPLGGARGAFPCAVAATRPA